MVATLDDRSTTEEDGAIATQTGTTPLRPSSTTKITINVWQGCKVGASSLMPLGGGGGGGGSGGGSGGGGERGGGLQQCFKKDEGGMRGRMRNNEGALNLQY